VNLAGNTISASRNIRIAGGTVRSDALAGLDAGDEFFLFSEGSVQGPIILDVSNAAHVDGVFDGLGITVGGDLSVSGELGNNLSVTFSGFDQHLIVDTDLAISQLHMSQIPGPTRKPKLTVNSTSPGTVIAIGNLLTLNSGILVTGWATIHLSGSDTGFLRELTTLSESHILGNVSRNAVGGSTDNYVFPVGGATRYRPATLKFGTPLLTSTLLTVQHSDNRPAGIEGLPVLFNDGTAAHGLTDYYWSIFSSVNFAQSQALDISVIVERTGQTPADHRILARGSNDLSDPWNAASEDNTVSLNPGLLTLKTRATLGLLSPEGTQLAVGTPEPIAFTSEIQFIQGAANLAGSPVVFVMDGSPVFEPSQIIEATSVTSIGLAKTIEERHIIVRTVLTNDIVAEDIVHVESGSITTVALLETESGLTTLAATLLPRETLPSGTLSVVPVNGSQTINPGVFSIDRERWVLASLAPGTIGPAEQIDSGEYVVELFSGPDPELTEQYRFDFSPYAGQNLHLLISGSPLSGTLISSVVTEDGSVLPMTIVTGVEEPVAGFPDASSFAVHQNYPNPFSLSTSIQFDLPRTAAVRIEVVDMLGRIVLARELGQFSAGRARTVSVDGSRFAAGIYLYRLTATSDGTKYIATGKMVRL